MATDETTDPVQLPFTTKPEPLPLHKLSVSAQWADLAIRSDLGRIQNKLNDGKVPNYQSKL